MKRFVCAFVVGVALWATPTFAQQGKLIGVIRNDKHHDSVKDLLKRAGCREDWVEQAYKDSDLKRTRQKNWKTAWIFSKDKKLPAGTRIYLVDADNCDMKPKDVAELKVRARIEAREVVKALSSEEREAVQKQPRPEIQAPIRVPEKPASTERRTTRRPVPKPPATPKPAGPPSESRKPAGDNKSPDTPVPTLLPVQPPPPPPSQSFLDWVKTHPLLAGTLVVLLIALGVIRLRGRKGTGSIASTKGPGIN